VTATAAAITNNSTVNLSAGAGQDNFVFAPNFGRATLPMAEAAEK
jgi:hypothetical protein